MSDNQYDKLFGPNLPQLLKVSEELNRGSRDMQAAIDAVEAKLKHLNLGITAEIHSPPLDTFGYSKVNGKWGLWWVSGNLVQGDMYLLRDAPREKRVECLKLLPKLVDELIKNANVLIAEIKNAHNLLAELGVPNAADKISS